jgi:hypothetical protein
MRNAVRFSLWRWLLVAAALPLAAAADLGCGRRAALGTGAGGNAAGGTGVGIMGAGGGGGGAGNVTASGTAGAGAGGTPAACAGASDARLVVADQRILRLTSNELLNTVRYLFGATEATALVNEGIIGVRDDSTELDRRFPPLQQRMIDDDTFPPLDRVAEHVAGYVLANFAALASCINATDACATLYLDKLATRAYRRQLTADEHARFAALYTRLRASQTVNGYDVTFTVEEATSYAVEALLGSPQMLWRWELGDPALASSAPAGIPLTEPELATHLAFFLTDQPPDESLIAAASAGTLRANLPAQVDRLLASPIARDWLRVIMETYLGINTLPNAPVDAGKFPIFTPSLVADMGIEARKFLDNTLWNGNLTDLLLSRTAFLNSTLASSLYAVAVPADANATTFIQTTLPADQRSGLLTNAGFLTSRARPDGRNLVVPRGKLVSSVLLCLSVPSPPADVHAFPPPDPSVQQTSQEQVAARAAVPLCNSCHAQLDPYGLALENYDNLGRYRVVDDLGQAVDAHTTLPAAIGAGAVGNGVELAQKLATSPAFTNCMARTLLQYAMVDANTTVDVPLPPQQAGCATADVVQRYQSGNGKTFTDLVRATAAAPAFALRRGAP